jgi:hypothetical protein
MGFWFPPAADHHRPRGRGHGLRRRLYLPDETPAHAQPGGLSDELQPYVDRAELARFDRMGELLRAQRPIPGADLANRVAAGAEADVPGRLRLQVGLALLGGLLLLGLALLGASGSGPLGG